MHNFSEQSNKKSRYEWVIYLQSVEIREKINCSW